jgi:hypothetical protein
MDYANEAAKPCGKLTSQIPGGDICAASGPPIAPLDATAILQKRLDGADHHMAAAEHHAKAAVCLGKAAAHFRERQYEAAAQEAQHARRHADHAVFHDDAGARHYAEHYGSAGPIAELA